jgi:hypothetical protein
LWDKTGDAFEGVFIHMPFEERLLDPVLEAFVGEVDAKLVMVTGIHSHAGLRERVLRERVRDKVF